VFSDLKAINERPAAFSQLTVAALWTDPHISEQMLRFHLDGSVALSSGTTESIEAAAAWITGAFHLTERSRLLDLGCGPGLYTSRFARAGVDVTGVDFSSRSIAYAREVAAREGLAVTYLNEDYLAFESSRHFDLVTMIMRDYCALAAGQRRALLEKVRGLLEPDGSFLFDVESMAALAARTESATYESAPTGGFWSSEPYFAFLNSYLYPEDAVSLDKYVIVEAGRTRTIYNWLQHFSRESLTAELGQAGLTIGSVLGDVAGRPFDPGRPEFAVVARPGS
jgi:SAM-dependent methyltransferase